VKIRKLKRYIKENISDFTEVDFKNDSRYLIIKPDTELFGETITKFNDSILGNHVKEFLSGVEFISNDLKVWSEKVVAPVEKQSIMPPVVAAPTIIPPPIPSMFSTMPIVDSYVFSGSNISYDTSNFKPISYEDLRKLVYNIAKSRLNPDAQKDETIIELEREKKRNLIAEIKEFKNVTKINPWINDYDLNNMTLDQLENCRELCEKLHSRHKIDEVLASSFNLCGLAYGTMFPEGIPISDDKRMRFDGVGNALRDKFFDARKTVGFSFSRVLSKKNIKITDELAILIGIGETILSSVKIVKKEDNTKQPVEEDDEDDDSDSELESV